MLKILFASGFISLTRNLKILFDSVTEIVKAYTPFFLMGSIMFFVQMTLQNINVALGQSKSALILAVTRKIIILIPIKVTYLIAFLSLAVSPLP
mgnify:CR=1 FL=1